MKRKKTIYLITTTKLWRAVVVQLKENDEVYIFGIGEFHWRLHVAKIQRNVTAWSKRGRRFVKCVLQTRLLDLRKRWSKKSFDMYNYLQRYTAGNNKMYRVTVSNSFQVTIDICLFTLIFVLTISLVSYLAVCSEKNK